MKNKRRLLGHRKNDLQEATVLCLLQPRKPQLYDNEAQYRGAPVQPALGLEAVLALGRAAREAMKARQSRYWQRPWDEMASDTGLLGGLATPKRRK
jgi:hypothetical protein